MFLLSKLISPLNVCWKSMRIFPPNPQGHLSWLLQSKPTALHGAPNVPARDKDHSSFVPGLIPMLSQIQACVLWSDGVAPWPKWGVRALSEPRMLS